MEPARRSLDHGDIAFDAEVDRSGGSRGGGVYADLGEGLEEVVGPLDDYPTSITSDALSNGAVVVWGRSHVGA